MVGYHRLDGEFWKENKKVQALVLDIRLKLRSDALSQILSTSFPELKLENRQTKQWQKKNLICGYFCMPDLSKKSLSVTLPSYKAGVPHRK